MTNHMKSLENSHHRNAVSDNFDEEAILNDAVERPAKAEAGVNEIKDSSKLNNHERAELREKYRLPSHEASVYPYPAIPKETRHALERCYRIKNIYDVNPGESAEMSHRASLNDLNHQMELIRIYCGDEINEQAYLAAALGPLMDLADGTSSSNHRPVIRAQNALGEFFAGSAEDDNPYTKKNIYVAGLLNDRRGLAGYHERTCSETDEAIPNDFPPNDKEWLEDPGIESPDTLYEAANTINLESILSSATETLVKLDKDHAKADRDTLDTIRYSERFIAPIAEVIGFDALAMALNSRTKMLRLQFGGRPDLIYQAEAMLKRFQDYGSTYSIKHNVVDAFQNTVKEIFHDDKMNLTINLPVDSVDQKTAIYGDAEDGPIEVNDGNYVKAGWRFRLKTVGSLAWKLYKEEQHRQKISDNQESKDNGENDEAFYSPMDSLGLTVVVPNEDDQKKIFRRIAEGIYDSQKLSPYPAPSKVSPIHIRGPKEYVEKMMADLPDDNVDIKLCDSDKELKYCKVTFYYDNLPIELQCVTRETRDAMQTGPLAHIIYKASSSMNQMNNDDAERWSQLLKSIKKRRDKMSAVRLVGANDDLPGQAKSEREAHDLIEDSINSTKDLQREIGKAAS